MRTLPFGKLRGLQLCASPQGTFTALALDHRQNLRKALNPGQPEAVTDADLTRFKLEVASALVGEATAVLFDPQFSAAQALAAGMIPKHAGLVVAVEATGYSGDPTDRQSRILPGWSVEKARRMGANMVKLLVYYHPDSRRATEMEDFVSQVAEECQQHEIALMLEPLSYSLDPDVKKLPSTEKRYVVAETARRLTPLNVDLLKAEFPLDAAEADESTWTEACAEVSTASVTPWILLSAAVDFETYLRQVMVACRTGASGVAVGRAVWKEAVSMAAQDRTRFLQTLAPQRLARLTGLCNALAKPWTDFFTLPAPEPDWYLDY